MKAWVLGIGAAVVAHGLVLTFGGIFFLDDETDHGTLAQVELIADVEAEPEKDKEKEPEKTIEEQELEAEEAPPPDATELMRDLELSAASSAPALDAASLGAIEMALSGAAGGGDFGDSVSFSSGGVIGGKGKAGALGDKLESAFSLTEIDQQPRAVFQVAPLYPAEMRPRKLEAVVTVIFIVDSNGKVTNPRVEKSTLPAFEKPALDAVRQWKFEPAIKAGERVSCKMRAPIRFKPS